MPSTNGSLYRRNDSMSSHSLKDAAEPKDNDLSYTDGNTKPIVFDKVILHKIAFAVWQAAFYLQKPRKVIMHFLF